MLNSVLTKTLFDRRRSIIGWAIGVAAASLFVALLFPVVRDTPEIVDLLESYPEAMLEMFGIDDINTYTEPAGFLQTQLFSVYVPLLLLIFSIGAGVQAIAGEESEGTLDLLLANPVPRTRVVLEKAAAQLVLVVALAAVVFFAVWFTGFIFDEWVGIGEVFAAVFSAVLLALTFGYLALAAGAATGRRGASVAVASAVAVATYIFTGIAPVVDGLGWLERLSPFFYYSDHNPLANGIHWGHAAILATLALVFLGIAVWGFRRRDVGVS
jgi:ABC-2 type transport system permease protein